MDDVFFIFAPEIDQRTGRVVKRVFWISLSVSLSLLCPRSLSSLSLCLHEVSKLWPLEFPVPFVWVRPLAWKACFFLRWPWWVKRQQLHQQSLCIMQQIDDGTYSLISRWSLHVVVINGCVYDCVPSRRNWFLFCIFTVTTHIGTSLNSSCQNNRLVFFFLQRARPPTVQAAS